MITDLEKLHAYDDGYLEGSRNSDLHTLGRPPRVPLKFQNPDPIRDEWLRGYAAAIVAETSTKEIYEP